MFCFGTPSLKCAVLACEIQLSRTATKEQSKTRLPFRQDSCNAMPGRRCSALSTSTPKAGHQERRVQAVV
jgi:hypothetical protein